MTCALCGPGAESNVRFPERVDWLIADNHDGFIIAVGAAAIESLRAAFD
jgi:hypothetical protein